MNDLKVGRLDPAVVTNMGGWLNKTYEHVFGDGSGEMKLACRKIHENLGMTLNFSNDGEVMVKMIPYVTEIVTLFLQHNNSEKTYTTPASEHLFRLDDSTTHLAQKQATIFHHFTAKYLFLTNHSRENISPTVAFLTTRVRAPDTDDWKNLVCLIF